VLFRSNSKSGSQKSDNTPHQFIIGGKQVECYFSPSDRVTEQISNALRTAGGDLEFLLYSFTHNDLGAAVLNRFQSGETVAGVIDNINDIGSEFAPLQSAGVDVLADNHPEDLHHKYAIVDAKTVNSDPLVVTGSHNWSNNAENNNDENTLIIHDANIANWFLQEFSKRYCEVKATANCSYNPPVSVDKIEDNEVKFSVFPNPGSDNFFVKIDSDINQNLSLKVFDSLGQLIFSKEFNSEHLLEINSSEWANGIYFVQLRSGNSLRTEKISVVR
jgi:hypothetical protein